LKVILHLEPIIKDQGAPIECKKNKKKPEKLA